MMVRGDTNHGADAGYTFLKPVRMIRCLTDGCFARKLSKSIIGI
jgi:hypothetical protein